MIDMLRALIPCLLRITTNIAITVASLIVGLLLAEWLVRMYMPSPDYGGGIRPAFYSSLFEYDEQLGWRGVANLTTPYFSKDFHITVTHDSAGYRNISSPYKPEASNYLLLGDSYAWGWGVEDDQTATAVFNANNKGSNMYNLGIAGYGTDQEYIALLKYLQSYQNYAYKGAILMFYINDLDDISSAERYGYPKLYYIHDEQDHLILKNVPVPRKTVAQDIPVTVEPPQESWSQKSELFNFAAKQIVNYFFSAEKNTDEVKKPNLELTPEEKNKIHLAASILANIKNTCKERDMFLHVVFLITNDTKGHDRELIYTLTNQLDEKDIEHSSFYSRAFPRTDLWLDAHYTPYGQALLADHIAKVIANKRVTDKKPASSQ
jgi:hypothetical protein